MCNKQNIYLCIYIYIYCFWACLKIWQLSKEVWKSDFRQYGQMKKQRWKESEKRRAEERRSEQRKSQKKEDAGARKGSKVETHCFSRVKKLKTFQVRSAFGC